MPTKAVKNTAVNTPVVETEEENKPVKAVKKSYKKGTVVKCEMLNVREAASPSAKILKTINAGTEVTIQGEENEFYKIAGGFVMKAYIES